MKDYKIIVIEGVDSSGKATQATLLSQRLRQEGRNVVDIEFPNYKSDSSAVVKMYLGGKFGSDPDSVSPYVASSFFAIDRYASVRGEWREHFANGNIVIADRYTTSNMVHQASKIDNPRDKSEFLDWLYDFEYVKLGLPEPDLVIFLDMPVDNAIELMKNRANKIDNTDIKDIHESNREYLERSYDNACFVAKKYGWSRIKCARDGAVRSIEDISDEIFELVSAVL